MKRHINIPIFIPHLGCPNSCVFCNQKSISGRTEFDKLAVVGEIERAIQTVDYEKCEVEIAFFGGSFTGIDREDMLYLLEVAKRYVDMGKAQAIRLSTRPDYIDDEILDILSKHKVTDIELGLQSFDEAVLCASKRGHTAECARIACKKIKEHGFNLVGQMMIGLPGSTPEAERMSAEQIVALGCDAARIYPTVVFADTELADMMKSQQYTPLTMSDAITRSRQVLEIFIDAHIPVIRLGLCSSENLFCPEIAVGGAYHSAFGELVYSDYYYHKICREIEKQGLCEKLAGRDLTVFVPKGEASKASGQKRANKICIQNEYNVKSVKIVENPELIWYNIVLEND